MNNNLTCLMPFVPLIRHGPELIVQAENRINDSDMPRKDRADMLTSMAILSGLISRELPKEMIGRRRDLMFKPFWRLATNVISLCIKIMLRSLWKKLSTRYTVCIRTV